MGTYRISQHYLPYLLNRADHALSSPLYTALTERGVALSDWRILAILLDEGRCTVGQLAAHVRLPQPTITHSIARLEARGEVSRVSGTEDRRNRFVELTPTGTKVAVDLVDLAERLETETLSRLDDPDGLRTELESVLNRLIIGLEQGQ